MNYKKLFAGFIIVVFAFIVWDTFHQPPKRTPAITPQAVTDQHPVVHVVLDTGDTIASYDGILANTVFDALKEVSDKRHDELKTKQYDFGIFVEAIGDLANTKDNAWIYSVNGKSGEVAADKYTIKNGDVVEWKYTKPLY